MADSFQYFNVKRDHEEKVRLLLMKNYFIEKSKMEKVMTGSFQHLKVSTE